MMTKAFAENGAHKVYIIGRRREKLDETVKLNPSVIVPIVGDVTSKESLCEVAEQIEKDVGYINLLCCNSGTMPPPLGADSSKMSIQDYRKKCLESKTEDWNQTYATNSASIFFTTMAFLELLDAGNKKGNCPGRNSQVLVTTSIAGFLRQPQTLSAYGSSKAAATHLIKHLGSALIPYSIRVNGLAPGLFPSDLAAGLIKNLSSEHDATEKGAVSKSFIPEERLGKPEDVAGTVLYLASPAAAYMHGNITVLDGGRVNMLPGSY
ncbi:hypothetical protein BAUCODRAFT_37877 [Baudoinia panamericana UAMH 10762]|uniref:Ketoreductase (KR) domain-containing protein n=1 Tax=Baudoinia panamericana (strain UAMH 10762) TaxID=717646 RepID=M2M9A0_BAUPA|nr:uncharacterized protein BAUCODRAFT_37877 [Baudoinia panamericana UAMH 10762]EMC92966.1 hypothetical protein BAUCODRAFT_37877 [Baudoinia panamericana UAMH 10762]